MPAVSRVALSASDGVALSALHWDPSGSTPTGEDGGSPGREGVAAGGARESACVVAHGFTGSASKPHVKAICAALAARGYSVLAPDLRGHGRSGGRCTAGADERLDIAAAVAWLRAHSYRSVAVLGWSMGGSAVLRHAGLGGDADAVVAVSSPGRWFERGTRPMRLVHWMCESPTGRTVTRLARHTRIAAGGWDEQLPAAPVEVAGAIAPTPLLIVHGSADPYFPAAHYEALVAATPDATHWLEPGMGHAETATTPQLLARIADWLAPALATSAVEGVAERAVEGTGVCDDDRRE